ncbi:MATE family efflux transporter [Paracoccus sp. p1-h21]|uniref:MATE family efflux transporter n=1 Tax=Paracoccus sp. p1-h21 TaxID=3366951 RepID=UPI0037AB8C74
MTARFRPHLIATLSLGLPLIGGHLARMAIGVGDTVMVGWYGVEALAALVLATSLQFILFMLGSGYAIGVMGRLAAALTRGDETEMRRATRMTLWLGALHTVLVLPVMWFSEPIMLALGQEPLLAALAQDYLRIACFGVFAMLWGMTLNNFLASMERTQFALWVTVLGLPLNVALNWVLIFGNLGAPEMGVRGAALASIAVQFLQLAVMAIYVTWLPATRHFQLFARFWRPDWPAFREILFMGLPVGMTLVAEVGMFVGVNFMMGWIGTLELAAHGIALQVASVAFMVHLGLANAATVRVGQAQGRGDRPGLRDAALTVLAISLVFSAISAAVFVVFSADIVRLYLDFDNPQAGAILTIAVGLMIWAAAFQFADGLQCVVMGLLRGVQDTRIPMLIGLLSYWPVGLGAGYVLAFPLGMGAAGLWAGLLIGLCAAALLLMWRFWGGYARRVWTTGGPAR